MVATEAALGPAESEDSQHPKAAAAPPAKKQLQAPPEANVKHDQHEAASHQTGVYGNCHKLHFKKQDG